MSGPNADEGAHYERHLAVAWLRRRAEMCRPFPSILHPFKRRDAKRMAGTFAASATLIERGIHWCATLDDEARLIASAMSAGTAATTQIGAGLQPASATRQGDAQ